MPDSARTMAETTAAPALEHLPVLIAGAGPTGLVLALWLTTLGVRVRIIDAAAEPGTTSRALGVQTRTLELYDQIGIASEVVAEGVKVKAVNLWVNGRKAAQLFFAQLGQGLTPFDFTLIYPQDAHEQLLIAHLQKLGVEVERRTELLGFEQRATDVIARLKRADGTEESCVARYLAGCDGAHSVVRQGIDSQFPGGTYSELFYVADLTATGPTAHDEIHLDLDQADFLVVFPLKGDDRIRIVGSASARGAEPRESITFADVDDRIIRNLKFEVSTVNWFSSYRVHHRVASRFSDRRAFLLGDAAHIHSPVGGQGMNTGIGDAINLAWKLAAVIAGAAPESLLESYEPERIAFARRLVATTDRVFTFVTKQGRIARAVRMHLVPIVFPLLARLAVVRRFLFRTVSQTGIEYRDSSLSSGAAGQLHGGDRLPWVRTAGADNFAPLRSMSWQAHVYGTASERVAELCSKLGLPLHTFEWNAAMPAAKLEQNALYLVRPDGYLALIDSAADPDRLARYFAERGLSSSGVSRKSAARSG
jgi:2-polyprenyl-6-methoxyphenol hydroxylase-like FAD-dependent oxidoreductase